MNFKNKVVLVTGGSQGIGKEISFAFAKKGAIVVVNDIKKDEIMMNELKLIQPEANFIEANVVDFNQVKDMMNQIIKQYGHFDILINNAGITRDNLLIRMKEEDFDQVIDINLKGVFNCMKHASRIMMKQRSGKIINMASVVGLLGNIGQMNYAASKAGVIGMSKTAAREFASRNITVNAVAPGFIQTQMTDSLSDEVKTHLLNQIPLSKFGQVSDVANAVLFLASDSADYITGQVISVDGGMAM